MIYACISKLANAHQIQTGSHIPPEMTLLYCNTVDSTVHSRHSAVPTDWVYDICDHYGSHSDPVAHLG